MDSNGEPPQAIGEYLGEEIIKNGRFTGMAASTASDWLQLMDWASWNGFSTIQVESRTTGSFNQFKKTPASDFFYTLKNSAGQLTK